MAAETLIKNLLLGHFLVSLLIPPADGHVWFLSAACTRQLFKNLLLYFFISHLTSKVHQLSFVKARFLSASLSVCTWIFI